MILIFSICDTEMNPFYGHSICKAHLSDGMIYYLINHAILKN